MCEISQDEEMPRLVFIKVVHLYNENKKVKNVRSHLLVFRNLVRFTVHQRTAETDGIYLASASNTVRSIESFHME